MKELWKADRHKHVRGWLISTEAAVRLCCGILLPLVKASAHRRGQRVSVGAVVSTSMTPPCAKCD
jgi:hypothetical protein